MRMSILLFLWTMIYICLQFCGLHTHVYTAPFVDYIHMSILLFLWTMIYICLQFGGLHTHVYTTLAVDYMYMSIMLFLWIIRLLRPDAVDTMFKSQN